ncbi:MAG: Fe-S cluster assembly ATPase SufC [Gammaproteobacteria bacterium PRO9]|nr:Fe-S cluster assembly ATPase SufC [Gammaproteobacteria bacterium PRO9]
MLEVRDLRVSVSGKEILKGLSLTVGAGEVHAIMGPNGSGKSTLAHVLSGRGGYVVTGGSATLLGQDLLAMEPEERARAGVFLGFQYPVEIPGVSNVNLLRFALNARRKARGEADVDAAGFLRLVKEKARLMQMNESFLQRGVNEGFSGGEKKRNEIFQMAVLEPLLAILDETDSGLDIDALKVVANGVNSLRQPDRGFLLITHYQRLLDYIQPDYVHVLAKGRIVQSGDRTLALTLEAEGYDQILAACEADARSNQGRRTTLAGGGRQGCVPTVRPPLACGSTGGGTQPSGRHRAAGHEPRGLAPHQPPRVHAALVRST